MGRRKNEKTQRELDLATIPEDSAVIKSMMDLRAKRRATALINLSKIKKRVGRKPKWDSATVSRIRTQWIASAGLKNVSLMQIAAINGVPVATVRKICYTKEGEYRKDGPVIESDISKYKVQLQLIQGKYDQMVKEDLKNIHGLSKPGFSAADHRKMEELRLQHNEETHVPSDAEQAINNIGGARIFDKEQAIQCARFYYQSESRTFDPELIIKLANEIAELVGI